MAHPSSRSDIDRYLWSWVGTALGRSNRGNQAGRRDLVSAWREALAWSNTLDCDDTYRHSGGAEWQSRGLDGAGKRRGIPSLTTAMPYTDGSRETALGVVLRLRCRYRNRPDHLRVHRHGRSHRHPRQEGY